MAVQLTLQFRDYQTNGLSGTSGVRNRVNGCRTCCTQVAATYRAVKQHLCGSVCVDSRHGTNFDTKLVVFEVSQRSQAVGRAGTSGNDTVVAVQSVIVNIVNDGLCVAASRCRNQNPLCAGIQVCLGLSYGSVEARAFKDVFNAVVLNPRNVLCLGLSVNTVLLAVNNDGIVGGTNLTREGPMSGIILQQVSQHCRAGQIVDCDNLDLVRLSTQLIDPTESQTTDTTEAVDTNFDSHTKLPPLGNGEK
ncbi:hypothetical protein L248_1318 [Schleiferilactobacillus shenzhenensis LY-73]|uniref:Uncharacterized protein n=1 Tax=Schleiferilactobacillus shenzhenensis LY-73 TaxID=1231336 RepID=U4TRZ7_9LACO|nr:hypothetical protein L248_1318 [Schleiferilactobacillus shenzhenensis LY-73]